MDLRGSPLLGSWKESLCAPVRCRLPLSTPSPLGQAVSLKAAGTRALLSPIPFRRTTFPERIAEPGLLHLSVLPSASGSAVEVESVSPVVDELDLSPESMPGASASSESESSPLASQKMRQRPFSYLLTVTKRLIDPGLYRSLWWPLRSLIKLPSHRKRQRKDGLHLSLSIGFMFRCFPLCLLLIR